MRKSYGIGRMFILCKTVVCLGLTVSAVAMALRAQGLVIASSSGPAPTGLSARARVPGGSVPTLLIGRWDLS